MASSLRAARLLCLSGMLTLGCEATYTLTRTTGAVAHPKRPNCQFKVLATVPSGPYEEVGILTPVDVSTGDPETFRNAVREDVCKLGGDVVVTEVNGAGYYVRGSVLRRTSAHD